MTIESKNDQIDSENGPNDSIRDVKHFTPYENCYESPDKSKEGDSKMFYTNKD